MTDGDAEFDAPNLVESYGGLVDCVVYLERAPEGVATKAWPEAMRAEDRVARLDVVPGAYEPHVQWVRAGTRLAFRSALGADINVHGFRGAGRADTAFNFALPPGVSLDGFAGAFLERPGWVFVTDDFRGGYWAYVFVSTHPYVDVTTRVVNWGRGPGDFVLSEVPPGEHTVVCWHDGFELRTHPRDSQRLRYEPSPPVTLTRRVKVEAGADAVVDFEFPAPK
jgi:hypothetical protein